MPRNTKIPHALIIVGMLAGCGDPDPVRTTLSALTVSQVAYDGREVVVSGTLRTFDDPRHYWIENAALDRVALKSTNDLEPLVGQTVEVSGAFLYDRNEGRRIEVTRLRTLP
jgi:hypothetical protein